MDLTLWAPANKGSLANTLSMKMKQVYISYNCCCDPGPVSKLAIFGSLKNRTNCVTDHPKGFRFLFKKEKVGDG